jgi:hypothetical protein
MVLLHLKDILTFVCLNKLVIFLTKGVENVNTAHLVLLVFVVGGGGFMEHESFCHMLCFSRESWYGVILFLYAICVAILLLVAVCRVGGRACV